MLDRPDYIQTVLVLYPRNFTIHWTWPIWARWPT